MPIDNEKLKPSERIDQLRRLIVEEIMRQEKVSEDYSTMQFLNKLTGTGEADIAESRLNHTRVWIGAIIAYLDEREAA